MKSTKKLIAVMITILVIFTAFVFLAGAENQYIPADLTTQGLDLSMLEQVLGKLDLQVDTNGIMDMYGRIMFTLQRLVDNILNFITNNIHLGDIDLSL